MASTEAASRTRTSPLRAVQLAEEPVPAVSGGQVPGQRGAGLSGPDLRRMMISEFAEWLRSRTSRHHRPFQEDTVSAYAETARVLDRWMTEQRIGGDFTACDTAMLNRFFASYFQRHGQGGTNTRQRNLRHPVHLAGGSLRAPASLHRRAAPVCPG